MGPPCQEIGFRFRKDVPGNSKIGFRIRKDVPGDSIGSRNDVSKVRIIPSQIGFSPWNDVSKVRIHSRQIGFPWDLRCCPVRSNQQEIQIGEFKSPFQKQSSEFKFYSGIMANASNMAIIDEVIKAMGPQILAAVEKATGSSSTASTARPVRRAAFRAIYILSL